MRALQYDAYGPVERLSLREVPPPRPVAGPLVRVTVAALNPKDALFREGKFKLVSPFANSSNRSGFPSAQRYSYATLLPSR